MAVPDNVPEIMRTLELRFGRPDLVVMALISRVQRLPTVAEGDFHGLVFYLFLFYLLLFEGFPDRRGLQVYSTSLHHKKSDTDE